MNTQTVAVHVSTRQVEIDACQTCRLFWFDTAESISLTPRSVLDLFQYVAGTNAVASTNGSTVTLKDATPPTGKAFYSVVK